MPGKFKTLLEILSIMLRISRTSKRSDGTESTLTKGRRRHKAVCDPLNEIEQMHGSLEDFERLILENESTIGIILGARGKGKSAIGMRILENVQASIERRCVAMGFDPTEMPKWLTVVQEIQDLPNDSFVLIDEGGILFSSRNAMCKANKLLSELLLVARHKNLSILFITQNSANLELNAIRQADYMLLKGSSLMQADFERKKISEIYKSVEDKFEEHKAIRGITYVYSDAYMGFVENSLPSFWNTKVSKAFRKR